MYRNARYSLALSSTELADALIILLGGCRAALAVSLPATASPLAAGDKGN